MKVFTGRIRPTMAMVAAVDPRGASGVAPVEVMVVAASKRAACDCVERHYEDHSEPVWTRKLRMNPDGSPPAALQPLLDSDLLDPTEPSCWVWLAMFHGHPIAQLTDDGVDPVGRFWLDQDTGAFEIVPLDV